MDMCLERKLRNEIYRQGYLSGYRKGYQDAVQDKEKNISRQFAENDALDDPNEAMNVSPRVFRCLERALCRSVRDVVNLPASRIRTLKGVGPKAVEEVVQALRSYGVEGSEWEYGLDRLPLSALKK